MIQANKSLSHLDARHSFMSRVRTATDHGDLMLVARSRKPGIAFPEVGMNHRPRHHGTPDEGKQAVRGDIADAPKADAAGVSSVLLDGHRDDSSFGFLDASSVDARARYQRYFHIADDWQPIVSSLMAYTRATGVRIKPG